MPTGPARTLSGSCARRSYKPRHGETGHRPGSAPWSTGMARPDWPESYHCGFTLILSHAPSCRNKAMNHVCARIRAGTPASAARRGSPLVVVHRDGASRTARLTAWRQSRNPLRVYAPLMVPFDCRTTGSKRAWRRGSDRVFFLVGGGGGGGADQKLFRDGLAAANHGRLPRSFDAGQLDAGTQDAVAMAIPARLEINPDAIRA